MCPEVGPASRPAPPDAGCVSGRTWGRRPRRSVASRARRRSCGLRSVVEPELALRRVPRRRERRRRARQPERREHQGGVHHHGDHAATAAARARQHVGGEPSAQQLGPRDSARTRRAARRRRGRRWFAATGGHRIARPGFVFGRGDRHSCRVREGRSRWLVVRFLAGSRTSRTSLAGSRTQNAATLRDCVAMGLVRFLRYVRECRYLAKSSPVSST